MHVKDKMKTMLLISTLIAFMIILLFPANEVHGTPAIKTCEYDSDLKLFTNKHEFTQGETILLNATTSSIDTSLEIVVKNPTGLEVFSDVIKLDQHGNAQIEIPLSDNAKNGTWKIFAITSSEQQVVFVGVGEQPQPQLSINPYSLKYPYDKGENAVFFIAAEPESYVYFRVIDPQGVQKPNDWTLALTEDGRCTYLLDLQGYKAGVYTVEISTEKEKASATFAVGIQPSVSPISIKTQLYSYHAGDAVLILGDVPPDVDVDIDVYDPTGDLFAHLSLLAHNGKMSTSFHLTEDAKTGTWKIKARSGSNFDVVEINVDGPDVFASQYTMSPLKQIKSGIKYHNVQCKEGLELVYKKTDDTSACVTQTTEIELVVRGWAEDNRVLLGCTPSRYEKCYPSDPLEYRKALYDYYFGDTNLPSSRYFDFSSLHTINACSDQQVCFGEFDNGTKIRVSCNYPIHGCGVKSFDDYNVENED